MAIPQQPANPQVYASFLVLSLLIALLYTPHTPYTPYFFNISVPFQAGFPPVR